MLGGSSGINVAGAIRLAKDLGPGHTIVTILAEFGIALSNETFQSGLSALEEFTGSRLDGTPAIDQTGLCLTAVRLRRDGGCPVRTGGE